MAAEQKSSNLTTKYPYPIPLWRYGFEWNPDKALDLARSCKARGGAVRPPLQDRWDLDRDLDGELAGEQLNSPTYGFASAELGRGSDIYAWGIQFLQYKTNVPRIGEEPTPVHTEKTGAGADIATDIILVGSAYARKAEDLKIEFVRDAGRLVIADDNIDVLREYLGEPQWFLDLEYAEKNKLLDALESGAFQRLVGIPVQSTDLASDVGDA